MHFQLRPYFSHISTASYNLLYFFYPPRSFHIFHNLPWPSILPYTPFMLFKSIVAFLPSPSHSSSSSVHAPQNKQGPFISPFHALSTPLHTLSARSSVTTPPYLRVLVHAKPLTRTLGVCGLSCFIFTQQLVHACQCLLSPSRPILLLAWVYAWSVYVMVTAFSGLL